MAADVRVMGGNNLGRFASLGTGTMGVCLKHSGMSVKTLDSWSAHGLSNLSGPAALCMFKCLAHIGDECVITQSSRTAGALVHASVLLASK